MIICWSTPTNYYIGNITNAASDSLSLSDFPFIYFPCGGGSYLRDGEMITRDRLDPPKFPCCKASTNAPSTSKCYIRCILMGARMSPKPESAFDRHFLAGVSWVDLSTQIKFGLG